MLKKIFSIMLFLTVIVNADTLKNQQKVEELTKNIMENISKGEVDKGFELISRYLVVPKSEFETTKRQFKIQTPIYKSRFGKSIGIERINLEKVGDSLIEIVYIQKFQKHVLVWNFYYYKPKKEWVLDGFKYHPSVAVLFKY